VLIVAALAGLERVGAAGTAGTLKVKAVDQAPAPLPLIAWTRHQNWAPRL
jgi:hypothetical protein